jgi:hypothetical protein
VPYLVLTGLSYPPDKRAEAGTIVDDIPQKSLKWLLAKGHIEQVSGGSSPKVASKPAAQQPKFTPAPQPELETKDGED